jgi:hypothetical protein
VLIFRDIAIVGGGCYGSFYAAQLLAARERGAVAWRRLLVADRDPRCRAAALEGVTLVVAEWDAFFDEFLADPADRDGDAIVPSPLMPHLMADWIVRRAEARWPGRAIARESAPTPFDTPFERAAADGGTRYVSFADWLCPVHCIEPAVCPETRAPRTWEMAERCTTWAATQGFAGAALFVCRHRVFGVGMVDVDEVLAGDRLVATAAAECRVLVGTVSRCHGAVTTLRLGATSAIRV